MNNPFHSIFKLSLGDFFAKSISFLIFIYLARVLGVEAYGILEFALSIIAYLLFLTDAGFEIWGTREVARGKDVTYLAARVVTIRIVFALFVWLGLVVALRFSLLPSFPNLSLLISLFALLLVTQAIDLRWIFMGQAKMQVVAVSLVVAQLVVAILTLAFIRDPSDVIWVPVFQFLGNLTMALFLIHRFFKAGYRLRFNFDYSNFGSELAPSFALGTSRGLALLSYSFDTILLGFLVGSAAVGWYSAAYRPVTVFLVIATTFYLGLFPILSRAYNKDFDQFLDLVKKSQRLTAILSVPIGVSGIFLAHPIILLFYGPEYLDSVIILQILAWSASLVFIRGTFRQALCAAGFHTKDLFIAGIASSSNVALNFILIPVYGMVGAAVATVASETLWVVLAAQAFGARVARPRIIEYLVTPFVGGIGMATCFILTREWTWPIQTFLSISVYFGIVWILNRCSKP